jgi:hypothetical protein
MQKIILRIIKILKKNRLIYGLGIVVNIIVYNYIADAFRYLRYRLVRANLVTNRYAKRIEVYKEIHKGERCFIVGTAPSLTYEDLALLEDEYCFGVNSIIKTFEKTAWRPTYYGVQDSKVYEKLKEDIDRAGLPTMFVGHRLLKKTLRPDRFIPYFHFPCFHARHGDILPLSSGFSDDTSEIVYDGYSVTYSMLQLAVYMGFSEIYLLGTDCNYDVGGREHFVESGWKDKNAASVGERMIYAFTVAKIYADKNNIKIFNATRGGMLEVFDRVDLDTIVS